MENTEEIKAEKKGLSHEEYEISRLRKDLLEFEDRVGERLQDFKRELSSLRNALNRASNKVLGMKTAELVKLVQMGVLPKDLLREMLLNKDGKEVEKKEGDDNNLSEM